MAPKILVVYASKYGQTAKIARSMCHTIESQGLQTELRDISRIGDIAPTEYAGVLIGTPVYAGKTNRKIKRWVRKHRSELAQLPTGLFTVSLNAADPRPEAREAERRIFREFQDETEFTPRSLGTFIGMLNYLEYNPILRFFMKRISASAGGPTDTTQDYELTDWKAVDSFTRTFCQSLATPIHAKARAKENTLEL